MDQILQLDFRLFQLVNQEWTNPFLDTVFSFMRNQYVWGPFYVFLISFMIFNFGRRGLALVFCAILVVTGSNYISSELIKKNVKRMRPCNEIKLEGNRRVLAHCGGGYSFTSSHATNHFSISTFFVLVGGAFLGRWRFIFLLWASLIAYAQVYVGVHYPVDVTVGSIVGAFCGLLGALFFNRLSVKK